ncbi:hypothetical protein HELRODRAFT_140459, partial [Helobdella robusta]
LLKLIEEMTKSGKPKLDESKCKHFKNLCKASNENVRRSFCFLWSQLEKNHSEVRRSSVQLIDILFMRSAIFRDLLLNNMQEFVELTLGTNHKRSLPLPHSSAWDMKQQTICYLKNWHDTFGKGYRKLDLAVKYLKNCKNINFDDVSNNVHNEAENERLTLIRQAKINATSNELNDIKPEISSCLIEIENCLSLLMPCPEQFDIYNRGDTSKSNQNENHSFDNHDSSSNYDYESDGNDKHEFRRHGLFSDNISLAININVNSQIFIDKTEDNSDILTSFYEKVMLLKQKYLNLLQRYLKVFTKCGASANLFKPALDLKMDIEKVLQKAEKIVVKNDLTKTNDLASDEESNFDDFIEKAPIIPYGIDLYHWGDSEKDLLPLKPSTSQMNWWVTRDEEEQVDKEALTSMKERVINFAGFFEPVKWKCRAPLSNGKLCIRMDRKKCPFHGVIIPRDKMGKPNDPNNCPSTSSTIHQKSESELNGRLAENSWRDPELEADISAAIGIDITFRPKNKGKNKNTKKTGLTDLKSLKYNTPLKRLEKKLFNKAAMKRVASTMDNIDAKRLRDKFGNNFNYA